MHVLVNWVIIGSGNDLVPVWSQAISWTNASLLSIELLESKCCEICIKIQKKKNQENAFE